jgi:N-acetylglucosaminyldiphosphoundecaprenol N-acetyl-beta-D-mannosaminyltransferase
MRLMGAPMDAVSEACAVQAIVEAAATSAGHWTITANLDHVRRYSQEAVAEELLDSADLVVADGMPLIWASSVAGTRLPERVSGSRMVWSICEAAGERQLSVFLLGGDPGAAERAARIFERKYRHLQIAGIVSPPVGFESDAGELARIQRLVTDAAPDLVFVALGFPKQDLLIRSLRPCAPGASFIGVGISLSYAAGDLAAPPEWICRLGLEWLHRLAQEPTRRLARRYLIDGLPFGLRMLLSAARHRLRARGFTRRWGWEVERHPKNQLDSAQQRQG